MSADKRTKKARLDQETLARRRVLSNLGKMSQKDLFAIAVRAGIYTKDGKLTKNYRDDAAPSASRPTD